MKTSLRKNSAAFAALKILFLTTSCLKSDLFLYLYNKFSDHATSVGVNALLKAGYATEEKFDGTNSARVRMSITITAEGKKYFADATYSSDQYYSEYMDEYGKEYMQHKNNRSLNRFYKNKRVELMLDCIGVNVFPNDKPTLDQLYHMLLPKDDPDFNVYAPVETLKRNKYPFYGMVQADDIGIAETKERFKDEGFYYSLPEIREFLSQITDEDIDDLRGCTASGVYISEDKILAVYRQTSDDVSFNRLSTSDNNLPAAIANVFSRISNFNRSIPVTGIGSGKVDALVITNGTSSIYSMVMGSKAGTRSVYQEKLRRDNEARLKKIDQISDRTTYKIKATGIDTSQQADAVKDVLMSVPGIMSVQAEKGMNTVTVTCNSVYNLKKSEVKKALSPVAGVKFITLKGEGTHTVSFLNYACSIFPHIFAVPTSQVGIKMLSYLIHTPAEEWRAEGVDLARTYALNVVGNQGFSLDAARDQNKLYVGTGRREIAVNTGNGVKRLEIPIRAVWLPFYEIKTLRAMSADTMVNPDGVPSFAYGVICYGGMEDCLAHCLRRATWYFRAVDQGDRVINPDGSEVKPVQKYTHRQIVPLTGFIRQYDSNGFRVDINDPRREKAMQRPARKPRKHAMSITMEEDEIKAIASLSKATGRSMNYLVRGALQKWIASDEFKQMANRKQSAKESEAVKDQQIEGTKEYTLLDDE